MRSFVISTPGLSVGRKGQTVGADELKMTDDQLDAFVQAGYAVEIHVDGPPRGRVSVAPKDTPLEDLRPKKAARKAVKKPS